MNTKRIAPIAFAAILSGFAVCRIADAAHFSAEITRTEYGVPHVTARDYGSLGYGAAYAYAEDNLCLLADRVVAVRSERAKYFGPDEITRTASRDVKNIDSDFYYRAF